jgi:hypothetical protein
MQGHGSSLIVIEPLTATALGGLAIDKAQSEITKWVGARIKVRVELALRSQVLDQGRPAKDQQDELSAVITHAVQLTARELFPDQKRLQKKFSKALLKGKPEQRPLVNGSHLVYITDDVYDWISKNDPQPGTRTREADRSAHPYLAILCRNIIAQYGFRAENNGAKNTILHPSWNRFWTTELFTSALTQQDAPSNDDPSPWPRRLGPLPQPAAARLERPVDQELADALTPGSTAVVCQVLSGMGGIGKTQIAAHYAYQCWNDRGADLLLWVNAATRESITTAYAHAGSEFCCADPSDRDRATAAFLAWLDSAKGPRWLIVLDDLTDPDDLRGLWPPTNGRGRTIVTTRRRDAALETASRQRIDVGLYTPEQALQYLTGRLSRPELLVEAAELAADLGYLPLALAQAAVYILDQPGTTCASYRTLLADRTLTLEQLSPELLPDDYSHTIAAALQLAIEHADQYEPTGLASALLAIASLLDPAGIPTNLFTALQFKAQSWDDPTEQREGKDSGPPTLSSRKVTDSLARLHRLNLVDYDGTTIRIHTLVQRARRDQLDDDQFDAAARATADALDMIWPEVENDLAYSASLRANVAHLREHAQEALLTHQAHSVLFRLGMSLGESGLFGDARQHFEDLRRICEDTFGPDHVDTLMARNNLASWQGYAGDPASAIAAFEGLLADLLRVLGPDHPGTLSTRHNLALWQAESRNAASAVDVYTELLTDQLRVLGPDDPRTLTTRNNLAMAQGYAGDAVGAVATLVELLADRLRVLGPDNPGTLLTRLNLASLRGNTGGTVGAVAAFEELLPDTLRALGPDHQYTLKTRNSLARWRSESGDAAGAADAFAALLADQLRVLGSDHPDTLATRHNLASCRQEAGDTAGAVDAYMELLADQLRVLGSDHPRTLATRHNLASCRGETGDVTASVVALKDLLADQLRTLGPDYPLTVTTRNNLAHWQEQVERTQCPK